MTEKGEEMGAEGEREREREHSELWNTDYFNADTQYAHYFSLKSPLLSHKKTPTQQINCNK